MQHGRRWDAHFRHHLGVGLQEFEVLQHRVVAEIDLAGDADALRLGLHTLELNAVVVLVDLDIVEPVIEIEVPEHAAVLAVGRALQPDLFLLLDDLRDFLVLDPLQVRRADQALVALRARLGDRGGAQIAADMVGAKGGRGSFHGTVSSLEALLVRWPKHRPGACQWSRSRPAVNPRRRRPPSAALVGRVPSSSKRPEQMPGEAPICATKYAETSRPMRPSRLRPRGLSP